MLRTLAAVGRAARRGQDLELRGGHFLDPDLGWWQHRKYRAGKNGRKMAAPIQAVTMLLETLLNPFPHPLATHPTFKLDSHNKTLELYTDMLKLFEQESVPTTLASNSPSAIPSPTITSSPVREVTPPSLRPDAVLFQLFLSSRLFRSAPGITRILGDMKRLGIEMTRNNWTTVIHTLALEGKEAIVLDLMDMMEPKQLPDLAFEDEPSSVTEAPQLPQADAVTYVVAIQGFLVHGHISMAERLLQRLEIRNLEIGGKTSDVLSYLRQKIVDGKNLIGRA